MKQILVLFLCLLLTLEVYPQNTVTLKAGTLIQMRNERHLKAADAHLGQQVLFRVTRDVEANGIVVIPAGTPVNGIVYEAKKSSMWGTRGRLGITIEDVILPDGTKVALNKHNIYIKGNNRTPLAIALSIFYIVPGFLVTGSKAEIPAGYETTAEVAWPIEIATQRQIEKQDKSLTQFQDAIPQQEMNSSSPSHPKFPISATIIKTDGTTINAIVYGIENGVASYKKQSNPNGPMYKQKMSLIKEISVNYE